MAYGFGVTVDSMKAEELRRAAAEEGYDSQYHDDVVTIADLSGLTTGVRVADGRYIVSIINKDISYVKLNSAMNGVRKAFSAIKNEMNKQYN